MSRLTFQLAEPPGSVELIALLDAEGAFFQSRQEAFPNTTADDRRRADALDPGRATFFRLLDAACRAMSREGPIRGSATSPTWPGRS